MGRMVRKYRSWFKTPPALLRTPWRMSSGRSAQSRHSRSSVQDWRAGRFSSRRLSAST